MKKIFNIIIYLFLLILFYYPVNSEENKQGVNPMKLTVTSTAFKEGGMIPSKYTCDGADVSPAISWSKGPEKTASYALISDDPDAPAGTWVHWVIYNIPANVNSLSEALAKTESIQNGALQGKNDFRKYGYGGPCPPGGTHRYFFKVYAIDAILKAGPGLTKKQLLKEMEGHILAEGELMGRYSR